MRIKNVTKMVDSMATFQRTGAPIGLHPCRLDESDLGEVLGDARKEGLLVDFGVLPEGQVVTIKPAKEAVIIIQAPDGGDHMLVLASGLDDEGVKHDG